MPRDKNKKYLRAPKENYKPPTTVLVFRVKEKILDFYTKQELCKRLQLAVEKEIKKRSA